MANTANLKRWWANYVMMDFGFSGQTLQTELTLACKIGDHRIIAAYDLIAIRGGIISIYDWKTSTRYPNHEWLAARWQTRVYPALLARSGVHLNDNRLLKPESIQMIYWFAEYPDQSTVFKYNADKYTADWSAIQDLVEEITSASDFPLTQEIRSCAFCRYRSYCGRGDRAGNWVDADPEDDIGDFHDLEIEEITGIDTLNLNTT
jgi:hypothetical protein